MRAASSWQRSVEQSLQVATLQTLSDPRPNQPANRSPASSEHPAAAAGMAPERLAAGHTAVVASVAMWWLQLMAQRRPGQQERLQVRLLAWRLVARGGTPRRSQLPSGLCRAGNLAWMKQRWPAPVPRGAGAVLSGLAGGGGSGGGKQGQALGTLGWLRKATAFTIWSSRSAAGAAGAGGGGAGSELGLGLSGRSAAPSPASDMSAGAAGRAQAGKRKAGRKG